MRELPKTGVKLWALEDVEIITEGCFFADDLNDNEVISAFVEVMEWLKEKNILEKAFNAWAEYEEQVEAEVDEHEEARGRE